MFVETDVAVCSDAEDLEVDASGGGDFIFVVGAVCRDVGGVAVRDVDVLFLDVDVLEEVFPHEGVVGLGVVAGDVDVFVEVEGGDV